MTRSPDQRLDAVEDRLERVEQLLVSTASYAESANQGLAQLTVKVDELTTAQHRTESRLDEFIFQAQRLFTQNAERLIRVEGQTDRLEAILLRLDRNYEAQQSQFLEFQRTTNAALERIDRVVDYLLRQRGNDNH